MTEQFLVQHQDLSTQRLLPRFPEPAVRLGQGRGLPFGCGQIQLDAHYFQCRLRIFNGFTDFLGLFGVSLQLFVDFGQFGLKHSPSSLHLCQSFFEFIHGRVHRKRFSPAFFAGTLVELFADPVYFCRRRFERFPERRSFVFENVCRLQLGHGLAVPL